ncbi:phage integrase N-terminal domain-containing protein [Piscinibacter sakaiensis]|uniref:phage integrase N-terminal domain-containing protein n=1 Tax=Piscinibacter sakaiensis TaxID=1547922 RepID=UPI003AAFF59E
MPTSETNPPHSRRRRQGSLTRSVAHGDTPRRGALAELSTEDLLAQHPAGKSKPLQVLDLILSRFNMQHTALEKTVSHKTRHDRALFLRRFFRDLKAKAGFRRIPDPRSLRQKHVQAMVSIWQREPLAPATIQTYLSFLRGLALWLRKPGMIGPPASYGLQLAEYERHEYAQRDKSWTPKGIDVDALLNEIALYDARACACMRLMQALAFRKKESLLIRPFVDVVPATETDLLVTQHTAEWFVDVHGKGGRKRWVAIDSQRARDAIANAQRIVPTRDAHMGDPNLDLKRNLRRLAYVMEKFGITDRDLGVTGHGLRHEVFNDGYEDRTGQPSPVRGGGPVDPELDARARLAVAHLAGHARPRAAGAYLGPSIAKRNKTQKIPPGTELDGSGST